MASPKMPLPFPHLARSSILCIAISLASCGGGGGGGGGSSGGSATPSPNESTPSPATALKITSIEFAQTHILPASGLSWTLQSDSARLTLVGKRDTLALITLDVNDAINPMLNASIGTTVLGKIALNAPASLPPTEANGAPYRASAYSAVMPAAWLVKGVTLSVTANNYSASASTQPVIGAPSILDLNIVPFYLFGATDANTQALSTIDRPSTAVQNDIYDKWPVSQLITKPFNGGRVNLPSIVIEPRTDASGVRQSAYPIANMTEQKDGYAAMSATLRLLKQMRQANGESATNNLYYGPMLVLDSTGKQASLGGGLGGGAGGVGDAAYSGIFIHEMGHAFGLPHAKDAYVLRKYPYAGGSTMGSATGYSTNARTFLNPLIDKSAQGFANCAANHQTNAAGQCFKQDIMQSGAEDRTAGFRFGAFADFNIGKIQQWFEGRVSVDTNGNKQISGGVITPDASYASGYARWDDTTATSFEHVPALYQGGVYGINDDLPVTKNVAVYTIMLAYSQAQSLGASVIYAPIKYTGNLIKTFDPSNAQDRTDFTIDSGKYYNYCKAEGCDYTLRITYADNSVIYRALKGGFRPWFTPAAAIPAQASDPLSDASFKTWAINVPATQTITKIELLDTPMVWKGLPAAPTVLLTKTN